MEYEVHAFHGPLARRRIGDAPAQELDPVAEREEVPQVAGGQIVQHGHRIAMGDEGLHEVGADEAGAACDEITHLRCGPPSSEDNATTRPSGAGIEPARTGRTTPPTLSRLGNTRRGEPSRRRSGPELAQVSHGSGQLQVELRLLTPRGHS